MAYSGQDLGGQIGDWIEAGGLQNNEKNRKIKTKYRENISITLEIFMLEQNTYIVPESIAQYLSDGF